MNQERQGGGRQYKGAQPRRVRPSQSYVLAQAYVRRRLRATRPPRAARNPIPRPAKQMPSKPRLCRQTRWHTTASQTLGLQRRRRQSQQSAKRPARTTRARWKRRWPWWRMARGRRRGEQVGAAREPPSHWACWTRGLAVAPSRHRRPSCSAFSCATNSGGMWPSGWMGTSQVTTPPLSMIPRVHSMICSPVNRGGPALHHGPR